ncbi:MAG: F0F1 ATP synthase subunit B [Patescibacteria group bacterium]|nr:F0F1 ATP synthase subunit B [Patescibacteria group bacterium]
MEELLKNLGINWKLLLAQIVNFAILLFLLKKLLYKPILKILEERRNKINEGLKRAEEIETKVNEIKKTREGILNRANQKAEDILVQARKLAEERKKEILSQAQEDGKELLKREEIAAIQQKEKIMTETKGEIANLIALVAGKLLKEKLSEDKERELAQEALSKL